MIDKTICGNGTCYQGASGHYCKCHTGFTNYGNKEIRCTELPCDGFKDMDDIKHQTFPTAHDLLIQLKNVCLSQVTQLDGEDKLETVSIAIDQFLAGGPFNDNRKVSTFLDIVENVLRLIAPFMKVPRIRRTLNYTDLEVVVHKGSVIPEGAVQLLLNHTAYIDMQWKTVVGDPSLYPGFAAVAALSFANLMDSAQSFFSGIKREKGITDFKIISNITTVTVSNRNTSHLEEPILLTSPHLIQTNGTNYTCAIWNSTLHGGSWSDEGCYVEMSDSERTVCSFNRPGTYVVIMPVYAAEKFELHLITWVGLSLSLVCLFICILTFSLIPSIKSPRTTIHLHLCITLLITIFIFLVGISRTENEVGCAVVAGLLYFFYLAAFCWMCLEAIQLFRMVVLVVHTNFKTLYMMAGGYGVPAVLVAISALSKPIGYGTKKYCWFNLDFFGRFFRPVCLIIATNVIFFIITVWKLVQKFFSLNPDLQSLQTIKTFIITAVAQLCILGNMWIFGSFQFQDNTMIISYLFTIFGSLQGVMFFIMHCLLSKQVREEYGNILSRLCAPQKKSYSGPSHSSKAQASKSAEDTEESHV